MREEPYPKVLTRLVFVALAAAIGAGDAAVDAGSMPEDGVETAAAQRIPDPDFLRQYAETYRFRLGRPTGIRPAPDGSAVLFLRSGPRSFVRDLWSFDPKSGEEVRLLTAADLLAGGDETLTAEEKARRERQRLVARGIARFSLSRDGSKILVPLSGSLYLVERTTREVTEIPVAEGFPIDPQLSPDARHVACAIDGDLWRIDVASKRATRLTTRPRETVTNGLAEFVAQEEMRRYHGFWWSPDGRFIAYQQTDVEGVEVFRIADPADPTKEPHASPYPRPGKRNAEVRLGVMPAAGGETTWVDWDRRRYPYLASVVWPRNAPLTILVQNRTQTEEVLYAVDAATGGTRRLLIERDDAWLNLDPDMPRWLEDGSGFLWTSERNGAWQLELRGRDGALKHAVTPLELGYRGLVGVDEASGTVVVRASADPTQSQLLRLPLVPGTRPPEPLTEAAGNHSAVAAEDGSLLVISSSPQAGPAATVVTGGDGRPLGTLRSLAEEPSFVPTTEFVTAGEDPAFHAAITRPRNLEPGRKYPVIVHVYGGPTSQMVSRSRDRYVFAQWMADHGYVVISIDGRGTPGRGRAWQRVIRGDFITLPLADQAAAIEALGARFPELDLERVGIYGWSFGGYFSAMAVMQRGDLFKAGVAGAPVCDWHDYDTHYTERYVGLPQDNPEGYRRSSVLTYAERLERPLLIIHGTADDNVYFMHSLKMSDALFRAGRPHDFLALAGFTHMVPDPLVTDRLYSRIMAFFDQHLAE
ncbi:MAG: S9 family peptidase [Acidobacteria bacterium]|nr:MAG: S9 family peptidase [Acidobacteriota bacterium]